MRRFFSISSATVSAILFFANTIWAEEEQLTLPQQNTIEDLVMEIQDIYGPIPLPESINWLLPLSLAGVVLLLLFLFFFFRRKKEKPEEVVPPHVTALEELDGAREYLENGRSLLYAGKVSSILRDYIEQRFKIQSTRQTTSEFLLSIKSISGAESSSLQPHSESLRVCLERCDMAKYACMSSDKNILEEMESSIRSFINQTQPEGEN